MARFILVLFEIPIGYDQYFSWMVFMTNQKKTGMVSRFIQLIASILL